MVSKNDIFSTKNTAEYDLALVHSHVLGGHIHFAEGRRLQRHLSYMGFPANSETDPVCAALESLNAVHFYRSERYVGDVRKLWHDVYRLPRYVSPSGVVYTMYIKIRMTLSCSLTIICSFHPEGWT